MSRTAEMFGCAFTTVANALDAYHVVRRDPFIDRAAASRETNRRRGQATPEFSLKIRRDVSAAFERGNRTPSGIGRELGIAPGTASKHMKALELTPDDGRRTAERKRRPDLVPAAIVARYVAGETFAQIAATLDTTYQTVRKIVARSGVERRDDRAGHSGGQPTTYDPSVVTTVLRLYDARFSYREVAQYCGISPKAVAKILARNGIQPRRQVPRQAQDCAVTHGGHVRAVGGAAAIREWAVSEGVECPERGLPPLGVLEAYIDAHPQPHQRGENAS